MVYSLPGIFVVYMLLMYGKGRQSTQRRQQEEVHAQNTELGERHRVVILHGLGGIGKTQLAITYAKQYRDECSAVFWLNT